MGNRGLWNLRVEGKWYRHCHPRHRVSYPHDGITLKRIKGLQQSRTPLKKDGWEDIPFPTPNHSSTDYVYTLDLDEGHFTISQLNYDYEVRRPKHSRINLDCIKSTADLCAEAISRNSRDPYQEIHRRDETTRVDDVITSPYEPLLVSVARPSPLNELQHRMFMDFTFQWRYYIDDPMIWEYPSPLFSTLLISLLRLAAWDFEVTFDTPVELPIGVTAVPRWKAPETDIFWFHGFLVVQRRNLDTVSSIISAISRATEFLGNSRRRKTRLILTSLRQVVLVEISPESTLCSSTFPLLLNTSARQCSPGFRVLSHAFTSSSWKQEFAKRETWALTLPPELLQMVFTTAESKAMLSFGQASFLGELWYYSTIPQLGDIKVLNFDVSIPCCGRNITKAKGVFCRKCFVWQHVECLNLTDVAIENSCLCLDCESGKTCWDLDIGAIGSANRRQHRDAGCLINLADTPKTLNLRLSQPSHLRPEIRCMGNLATTPPRLVNYTIRFNGDFSGLAYGLEDDAGNLFPK